MELAVSERLARSAQIVNVWKEETNFLFISSLEPFSRSLNHTFMTESSEKPASSKKLRALLTFQVNLTALPQELRESILKTQSKPSGARIVT